MSDSVEFRHLEYLVAVEEQKNFTRAAKQMYRSQPALSQQQFGADRSAADWRKFGRAPGFTNRKPEHRNGLGFYPFARLYSHIGQPFAEARAFQARILTLQRAVEEERATVRRSFASRSPHFYYARLPCEVSHISALLGETSRSGYGVLHRRVFARLGHI